MRLLSRYVIALLFVAPGPAFGGEQASSPVVDPALRDWQYGGFADLGYLFDVDDPSNEVFRSRGTTWHLNAAHFNMMGAYLTKAPSDRSRWGTQLLLHTGKDDELFGFSATAPAIDGAEWLRHVGWANVSYLAPAGNGLTIQGGIFASLIGYDSLYAKDNYTYTRPWGADFTPYLMMGVNVAYPVTEKLTTTMFVINGYWHLANANRAPSAGLQLAYEITPRLTAKQTVLSGPHQPNTSFEFWRHLSDTIVEHKTDRMVLALEFHVATERVDSPARPRATWAAAQALMHWRPASRWSITVRPEIAHDSDGRWTLARQTVKAITSTIQRSVPYRRSELAIKVEHRFDASRGADGGFFRSADARESKPSQQLLILGLLFTFDSTR